MRHKRQTVVVFACIAGFAIYFLLQLASATARAIVALTVVPTVLLVTIYVTGYQMIRARRLRSAYVAAPFLLAVVAVFVLLPDFRRTRLRQRLESLGARVTFDFDDRYTYLPTWLKEELDWALLGRIRQVDFGNKPVPVTELFELSFEEPIWFLNLEGSEISLAALNRMPEILDAKIVHVSRTPADNTTLDAFAQMPSIKIIRALKSSVTPMDAREYRKHYPQIYLVIGPISPVASTTNNLSAP